MYIWLRTLFLGLLALTLTIAPFTANAQNWDWDSSQTDDEDEDYEWKTWKTHRSHGGFSGFGGFYFNAQTFESDAMNNLAVDMGLKKFDSFIPMWGGLGMGHVGNGWRIGGGGHGGHAYTDGIYHATDGSGETYNRKLEMDFGMGGFMFEYSPWMVGPVNFGLGAMVGGGGVSIIMSQDNGTFTWDELSNQYVGNPSESNGDNIRTEIDQGFFIAEPYVTMRVHILDWMAFQGSAGYTFTSLRTSNWEYVGNKLTGDGPEFDLNKPFYRVGLVFGG